VKVIRLDGLIEMTAANGRWRPRDIASTPFCVGVEGANLRVPIDIDGEVSTIGKPASLLPVAAEGPGAHGRQPVRSGVNGRLA
jgi:hypothetical protein